MIQGPSELELSETAMRSMVEKALGRILPHIASLPEQPAQNLDGADELAASMAEPLPQVGTDLDALLDLLFDRAIPKTLNTAGPGYLAYIPSGGLFHAAVADLIADAVNRYVGIWAAAPALVQIEANVIHWFCEMVGYPKSAGGILTSGGSIANLTAVIAARVDRLPENFLKGTIYTSSQTHHSVEKAAALAGFPLKNVRTIETDKRQRIRLDLVRQRIAEDRAEGFMPFMLVVNAGTTNTGAVDDLARAADLVAELGLWMHVDGAYGGFFAMTEEGRQVLNGIERADSITLDPHKGLALPYGTGCLLVKEPARLRKAHHASADYLQDMQVEETKVDFSDISPELSRPFRGLRAWLPLKLHGIGPFLDHLNEKLALAKLATEELRAIPGIEIVAEPQLSILAFRLKPQGLAQISLNELNRKFLERINAAQRVCLTPTFLEGAFVIRIALLSFRTHEDRLRAGLEDIRREAAAIMRSLQD
jgi:aromatic-L-amino-acid/L-tryptophan decarboxylase